MKKFAHFYRNGTSSAGGVFASVNTERLYHEGCQELGTPNFEQSFGVCDVGNRKNGGLWVDEGSYRKLHCGKSIRGLSTGEFGQLRGWHAGLWVVLSDSAEPPIPHGQITEEWRGPVFIA